MSPKLAEGTNYKVADLDLAPSGRMKIDWAESRMPVMMALREEHAAQQSLRGMADAYPAAKLEPLAARAAELAGAHADGPHAAAVAEAAAW